MARYIFDLESDNLLDKITVVHCLVLKDIDTGVVLSYGPNNVAEGVEHLASADLICGHNIIDFDIPALQKMFPWFRHTGEVIDTIVCTRLIWPSDILKQQDFVRASAGKFPARLIGRHSLEAWGHRLSEYKGKKVDFSVWTQEMQDYCEQDVAVTAMLLHLIESKKYSPFALWLEHAVAFIIAEQERNGVPFDEQAAAALYAELVQKRLDLETECKGLFAPWLARSGGETVPKRDNKRRGITAGAPYQNLKEVTFNPGSRQHIARCLITKHGWKPETFTSQGDPEINEVVLSNLSYPEAKTLTRYLLVQKRIGQLAEGKEALMKKVVAGRIHGEMTTNGAVTGRGTHQHPNLGQVPKVKVNKKKEVLKGEAGGWGWEFRGLFRALQHGWKFVGADASGLELRMLGHFMARWDGGNYAKEVVEGDVHSINTRALGIDSRDKGKTWFYAFVYGAGDLKLGKSVGVSEEEIGRYKNNKGLWSHCVGRQARKGKPTDALTIAWIIKGGLLRAKFLKNLPALGSLVEACKAKCKAQGYIIGLDKRVLHTRSEHSTLNTLLQSAGALVCKLWLVLLHRALLRRGYRPGLDYQQVLWVHDEVQLYVREEVADEIGRSAKATIKQVGEYFGLKVPLDGESKVGNSWAETH